jgi:hypothetical protein
MLSFFNKFGKCYTYCQNNEEGILEEIIKRVVMHNKVCVEIGSNNGVWLSNTAWLIKEKGFTGLMVEADYNLWEESCKNWAGNDKVKSTCSMVSEANINAFITEDCDIASIDTDGIDYAIFRALIAKPKVVIIEIDSSIPPDADRFNSEGGAGYLPMVKLAHEKGYFLLCHTGNLVLVDKKYRKWFPEVKGDGLKNSEEYFRTCWLNIAV